MTEETNSFAQWVILELMGHRRLGGYLTEQEIAGKGFLRLEIPGDSPATQLYNPGAVYCITPTTEEIARVFAARCQPAPVHHWELRELPAPPQREVDDAELVDAGRF